MVTVIPSRSAGLLPVGLGQLLRGPRHLRRRFDQWGEVLWDWVPGLGRTIWLRDPQLIEQVIRTPGTDFATMGHVFGNGIGVSHSLVQLSGKLHQTMRRVLAPALRDGEALARNQAAISSAAERLADSMPADQCIRLLPVLHKAVCEAGLETALGLTQGAELRLWTESVLRVREVAERRAFIFYGLGLFPWYPPARRASRAALILVREEVARRRRTHEMRDDVLGRLMNAVDDECTDEFMVDQLVEYAFGSQTSAIAAAWTIERAVRHPRVWERVTAESQNCDGHTYTDAVIREALRVRPPNPVLFWTLTQQSELDGQQVPGGTHVAISIWDLHHNDQVYTDPEKFSPERFTESPPPRRAWMPFASGPHQCPASHPALIQVRTLVQTLARQGRLTPPSARNEGLHSPAGWNMSPAQGCRIILQKPAAGTRTELPPAKGGDAAEHQAEPP